MSKLVRRVLGENSVKPASSKPGKDVALIPGAPGFARDFILSSIGRPEIEQRFEYAFAQKLGLRAAQCRSIQNGPSIGIEIQFELPERSRIRLSRLYFILREVAQLFHRQLVPRSALMELAAGGATLTFMLEPLN
jgi:hypothetical protein